MDALEAVLCKGVGDSPSQGPSQWNLQYTEVNEFLQEQVTEPYFEPM